MIRSVTTESYQNYDGLLLAAEIIVIGGSTRQKYSVGTQTYEDDRTLVPCILYADMACKDPAVPDATFGFDSIEWWKDVPDDTNPSLRITNPSAAILDDVDVIDEQTGETTHQAAWREYDYLISDGSERPWCSDVPAGALVIRKNVEPRTSEHVYAVIKSTDPRTLGEIRQVRHINLTTDAFDDASVYIRGSWGRQVVFDPLTLAVPAGGASAYETPWNHTVSVRLHGVEGVIPVADSCFQWLIGDLTAPTGWRKMTELEKKMYGISDDTVADLTIDLRCLFGEMKLRCYGCRLPDSGTWADPTQTENPFYDTSLVVKLNASVYPSPVLEAGASQNREMSADAVYDMKYKYGNTMLADGKDEFFRNYWHGQNISTRQKFTFPAGPHLSFRPCDYGVAYADGFLVGSDVAVFAGCRPVSDSGRIVVDDVTGKVVISPIFE